MTFRLGITKALNHAITPLSVVTAVTVLAGASLSTISGCRNTAGPALPPLTVNPNPPATPVPTQTATPPEPTTIANATALFSDPFDTQPDWQSQQQPTTNGGIGWPTTFASTCTTYCPPQGWTSYRVAKALWAPNAFDTYLINATGARGAGGKGLTYNVESTGVWGTWAGGGLDKFLGAQGYPELYVRFWIKEPPEFCWGSPALNLNAMGKLLRITALRRDPTTNPGDINPQRYPSADTSPTLIGDGYRRFQPNYGIPPQFNIAERYAPDYEAGPERVWGPNPKDGGINHGITFPNDSTTGGAGYCGDNRWHSYEYFVRMNSAPGVADGAYRAWLDGRLVVEWTTVPWVKAGTDANGTVMTTETGWNWVMIADNLDLTSHPAAAKVEMPRYLDDVVISEHYSGPPPAPTGLEAESPGAGKALLRWTAGSNGASYLLSGYRVYYGTAANALTQVVAAADTTLEIGGLASGQTYYFEVRAVKKAAYDANENEGLGSSVVSLLVN